MNGHDAKLLAYISPSGELVVKELGYGKGSIGRGRTRNPKRDVEALRRFASLLQDRAAEAALGEKESIG